MGIRWPFCREEKKGPKTINVFLGFFFMVNFCLGTGFLGIPFSFFYAGYLASIPTLLLIAFVSWNNAEWEVETMARAQALELWQKDRQRSDGEVLSESEGERESLVTSSTGLTTHPCYEVRLTRKFEPTELCEIFLTKWGKAAYIVAFTIYSFLACWTFATVAGSAWATNIPFNTSTLQLCDSDEFLHVLIPSHQACRNTYMLCVFFFAVVTVPLSLLDLKEQAILQMILGLLRFATIGGILVYSVVKLAEGENDCVYTENVNVTNMTYLSLLPERHYYSNSSSEHTGFDNLSKIVFRFDPVGWLVSIPVFTYAYIIHQGIPALTHPIRQKHLLRQLMVAMFGIATISYLSLGVVVPLWFKADLQETVTLNWVETAKNGHPALRALSYYLVIFPSIDVTSAYPLVIHTIANNTYTTLVCRDTSKKSNTPKLDFILQLVIKFVAAILPIAAALLISNLVYVLKYAGLIGFFTSFFFPTALQLSSTWKCSKVFPVSGAEQIEQQQDPSSPKGQSGIAYNLQDGPLIGCKRNCSDSLVSRMFSSYQTPYSNRFLSHPAVVTSIGGIEVVLFLLAIGSLALHPKQLHCSSHI